ncbi:rubrerythrin [Tumebacillus sp. BK434]|nr:rubrerythrin [Tumebacillus sp. BK434]
MYHGMYWPVEYAHFVRNPQEMSVAPFADRKRFLQLVLKAIYNEREAQLLYRDLEVRAVTPFQKRQIRHAYNDEVKHERLLSHLYHTLTGRQPQVAYPPRPEIPDFQTALRGAFEDELEAVELYRDMYLMTQLQWVRDVLFQLFTDEYEHATRFAYLRAEL